mmetsp:Transcript_24611/g.46003  ORF Transcript_24611/g.46003 Transcript_24611/m.46003 type:complete len:188 (+) Transcript_24611:521-1084(+)
MVAFKEAASWSYKITALLDSRQGNRAITQIALTESTSLFSSGKDSSVGLGVSWYCLSFVGDTGDLLSVGSHRTPRWIFLISSKLLLSFFLLLHFNRLFNGLVAFFVMTISMLFWLVSRVHAYITMLINVDPGSSALETQKLASNVVFIKKRIINLPFLKLLIAQWGSIHALQVIFMPFHRYLVKLLA